MTDQTLPPAQEFAMDRRRLLFIAAGLGVALMGVAALAFFTASHPRPDTLMSGLRVAGLSGYDVRDTSDRDVGHVIAVETDRHGRTRYIRAALNGGEKVRIAAFRARLDRSAETINLTVPVAAVVTDPGAVVESGPSVDVADAGGPAS